MTVYIDVDTKKVLTIDEIGGTFEVQQLVVLTWKDARIKYLNLKDEDDNKNHGNQNSLLMQEKDIIWTPTLTFLNTANLVRLSWDVGNKYTYILLFRTRVSRITGLKSELRSKDLIIETAILRPKMHTCSREKIIA